MTESSSKEKEASPKPATLTLTRSTLELKNKSVRGFGETSGNRSTVTVQVKKRRTLGGEKEGAPPAAAPAGSGSGGGMAGQPTAVPKGMENLTDSERAVRLKALEAARQNKDDSASDRAITQARFEPKEYPKTPSVKPTEGGKSTADDASRANPKVLDKRRKDDLDEFESVTEVKKPKKISTYSEDRQIRLQGKLTLSQVLNEDEEERLPSLAAVRRARAKMKKKQVVLSGPDYKKQVRDVTIPDTITVQELANRMATQAADVIKSLMKLGIMATINHVLDADTAELIVTEFGHTAKRVSESDVEIGMSGDVDNPADLMPRAPVVTVMGHVDHGKTSLLDAIKSTDVAAHEAGGITQHIGAYRVVDAQGRSITFIDTPGHEAFTEMRARGANVTDIVVLVVAADDGVMPQTIEAIQHAQAAKVPIIVAVNKIDKPGANPMRIKTDLLSHNLVVEEMGGDVQCIEVSATQRTNLDKLEEAIQLQAEVMELKANPARAARGTVIEAKMEQGRGAVATVLIQSGTLRTGSIFVAGAEWGKVRALFDDKNRSIKDAGPSDPVEVLGLNGAPLAGEDFVVVENEAQAREIAEYRQRKIREKAATQFMGARADQMFSHIGAGHKSDLAVIIKADVHGSVEAIKVSLQKLGNAEVSAKVLSAGVGAITETDVSLAKASNALIVAFNVRPTPQARDQAKNDGITINYYSIIYALIDDVKALLSGLLAPTIQEDFIGYAEIRDVFNITKVGRVAGCFIKEGVVKRGAGVRLLRDNVVVYEGSLKTLKRFKDEVREVKEGFECGMAFENYEDIKVGDVIECFEKKSITRTIDSMAAAAARK